jgi:hypothetical protein
VYAGISHPGDRSKYFATDMGLIAVTHGHDDVFAAWIQAGGTVHTKYQGGISLGHMIAMCGQTRLWNTWADAGGDVAHCDNHGSTIGHYAARSGRAGILADWIRRGGNVHATTCIGWTIGHEAAEHGHAACMDAWIHGGGDIHVRDHRHRRIADIAADIPHSHARSIIASWIKAGGCVVEAPLQDRLCRVVADMPEDPAHPNMIITKACLRVMGYVCHPETMGEVSTAYRDPSGRALAERCLQHMTDPLQVVTFASLWKNDGHEHHDDHGMSRMPIS